MTIHPKLHSGFIHRHANMMNFTQHETSQWLVPCKIVLVGQAFCVKGKKQSHRCLDALSAFYYMRLLFSLFFVICDHPHLPNVHSSLTSVLISTHLKTNDTLPSFQLFFRKVSPVFMCFLWSMPSLKWWNTLLECLKLITAFFTNNIKILEASLKGTLRSIIKNHVYCFTFFIDSNASCEIQQNRPKKTQWQICQIAEDSLNLVSHFNSFPMGNIGEIGISDCNQRLGHYTFLPTDCRQMTTWLRLTRSVRSTDWNDSVSLTPICLNTSTASWISSICLKLSVVDFNFFAGMLPGFRALASLKVTKLIITQLLRCDK